MKKLLRKAKLTCFVIMKNLPRRQLETAADPGFGCVTELQQGRCRVLGRTQNPDPRAGRGARKQTPSERPPAPGQGAERIRRERMVPLGNGTAAQSEIGAFSSTHR